jgi:hypothetical protein
VKLPAPFRARSLLVLGWLVAAPAEARDATAGTSEEPRPLPRPGQVDLRLLGAASLLPLSLEAGASAEVGVLPLGPGTLSLGAELSVNQCALACWVPNLFTERDVSRRDIHALGRLGYHFGSADRNYRKVDLYGVLLAGVMEARTTLTAPDYAFEGRGRPLAFGLGVGGNYFPSSRFFVGGEARLRFASSSYELSPTRGTYAFTWDDRRLFRLGLSTAFFVGVRLF